MLSARSVLTFLALAALCGCGTTSTLTRDQQTDYVIVSHSQAGGVWGMLRGKSTACKLTTHGVTGLAYDIAFDGEGCEVSAGKGEAREGAQP